MRVIFMGTPDFAVPTLARLAQEREQPAGFAERGCHLVHHAARRARHEVLDPLAE